MSNVVPKKPIFYSFSNELKEKVIYEEEGKIYQCGYAGRHALCGGQMQAANTMSECMYV